MTELAPLERRLGQRNRILGEASEGAVEAPSDKIERRRLRWQHPV